MESPVHFSFRRLLHSFFPARGDAFESPGPSPRQSRWSRRSDTSRSSSASLSPSRSLSTWSSVSSTSSMAVHCDDVNVRPYTPNRLDGEFNVSFQKKPLGIELVPSTQLYGTWEVSAIANSNANQDLGSKIQCGDVLVAVNFNARIAKLPHSALEAYLHQSACPVLMTFRRPALYGAYDSRAMSTAMFPSSSEHRGRETAVEQKTFPSRATASQWKHSLHHELTHKEKMHRTHGRHKHETTQDSVAHNDPAVRLDDAGGRPRNLSSAEFNAMGEYTVTFHEVPLRVVFAPSTRLYGSVEVFDPVDYAPLIQIGDVLIAVNGEAMVTKGPMDTIADQLQQLKSPVTITFRRPSVYRKYLKTYFHATRSKVSSRSVATAMFPNSAEYKHRWYRQTTKKATPTRPRRGSMTEGGDGKHHNGRSCVTKQEWQLVSKQFSTRDQFKLWQTTNKRVGISTSAFLTKRHVQYLYSHLPEYLTCNDMELIYDTRRHGWNMLTFYARVRDKGPALLVVKDAHDQIFGAFSSTSWKHSDRVYGNGRCFVFSLRPQMKVYTWSGLNDSFMHGKRDSIVMGGGKNGIALFLQLDEMCGFSHPCETFDSPSLTPMTNDGSGSFDMENVEVWCFSGLRV